MRRNRGLIVLDLAVADLASVEKDLGLELLEPLLVGLGRDVVAVLDVEEQLVELEEEFATHLALILAAEVPRLAASSRS